MKFVALYSLVEVVDQTRLAESVQRRAEYRIPEGMRLIDEYWSARDSPAVISVFEADDAAPILENAVPSMDFFETTGDFPVVSVEEGPERFSEGS